MLISSFCCSYLQVGRARFSLYELFTGTLVYSQAEEQGPLRQAIIFDIITKAMKSKSKKQFPTWSQNWLFFCNSFTYPPPWASSSTTKILVCPFKNIPTFLPHSPHLPVPNPWLPLICFPFLKLCHFKNVTSMELCWPFEIHFFHST